MFCIHCGTQIPEDARFCFKCGRALSVGALGAPNGEELSSSVTGGINFHPVEQLLKEHMMTAKQQPGSRALPELHEHFSKMCDASLKAIRQYPDQIIEEPYWSFNELLGCINDTIRILRGRFNDTNYSENGRQIQCQIFFLSVSDEGVGYLLTGLKLRDEAAAGFTAEQFANLNQYPMLREFLVCHAVFMLVDSMNRYGSWDNRTRAGVDSFIRQVGPYTANELRLTQFRASAPSKPVAAIPQVPQPQSRHSRSAPPHAREPVWEYCEVEIEQKGMADFVLHALAVGSQGEYVVFSSRKFKAMPGFTTYYVKDGIRMLHSAPGSAGPAIQEVTRYMAGQGWQPLPRGQYWYSYRFRRDVAR